MFEIQKKLKNNAYNWDSLKTEEIIHLHQVNNILKELSKLTDNINQEYK